MTSTLSVILMEIVQKAMVAQNLTIGTSPATVAPTAVFTDRPAETAASPGGLGVGGGVGGGVEHRNSLTSRNETGIGRGNGTELDEDLVGSYWSLALLTIPACTIFGNLLVIISVVKFRSLHSPINYFILGLAVADMCVALAVMPFAVYVQLNKRWKLGTLLCDLYCTADVTCSTASIFLLTVISFDRYVAATQPIRYANSSKSIGRVAVINAAVWLVSMLIASPMVLGLNNVPDRDVTKCMFYNADFIIYSSTGSFCIPLVIIVYLYARIYRVIRERSRFAVHRRRLLHPASSGRCTGVARHESTGGGGNKAEAVAADQRSGFNSKARRSIFQIGAKSPRQSLDRQELSRLESAAMAASAGADGGDGLGDAPMSPSSSVSSSTSGSSSANSISSLDSQDVDYKPHVDLINHLQQATQALVSRHGPPPDGELKRKSSSLMRMLFSATGGGSKRGSWQPGGSSPALPPATAPPCPATRTHFSFSPREFIKRSCGELTHTGQDVGVGNATGVGAAAAADSTIANGRLQRAVSSPDQTDLRAPSRHSAAGGAVSASSPAARGRPSDDQSYRPLLTSPTGTSGDGSRNNDSSCCSSLTDSVSTSVSSRKPSATRNYETFESLRWRDAARPESRIAASDICLYTIVENPAAVEHRESTPNTPPTANAATATANANANATALAANNNNSAAANNTQEKEPWYHMALLRNRLDTHTGNGVAKGSKSLPLTVKRESSSRKKSVKKAFKSQRKEKKATKTLAIVLGIFLVCWLPFFALNLLNAVCIKLDYESCRVGFLPFLLTTWLGYTNSLMNPCVYTIFNMDFRRAFKQILCPCFAKRRTRRV